MTLQTPDTGATDATGATGDATDHAIRFEDPAAVETVDSDYYSDEDDGEV
jgi:hypothetical protein